MFLYGYFCALILYLCFLSDQGIPKDCVRTIMHIAQVDFLCEDKCAFRFYTSSDFSFLGTCLTKNEMVYGFISHEEVQRGLIKFELFLNSVIQEIRLLVKAIFIKTLFCSQDTLKQIFQLKTQHNIFFTITSTFSIAYNCIY